MRLTRRSHLAGLGALAMAKLVPAKADTSAFVGIWSAAFIETDNGLVSRVRLEITADGKAIATFIDIGNVPFAATGVHLTPPTLAIDWDTIGLKLSGTLKDNDILVAHISGPATDKPNDQTFKRGDLFPVNTTVLPHAVMSTERLHQLRLISEAPALGVAYAFKNQPDHVLVDGVRSVDTGQPVMATDCWHIGSCTKSMTATLAARLVEAGRIRWTTTIGEVLGRHVQGMHPACRDANLLHLLSHRAGLMRDPPGGKAFRHRPGVRVSAERLVYVTHLLRQPPIARLGTTNIYSNGGFVVVGAMLEIAAGKPYETLMRELVFAPLGMSSGGFGPPATAGHHDAPLGHGHKSDGRLLPIREDRELEAVPPCMNPCGGVHLSFGDLLAFLKAHRDHPALLTEESWKTLHTPPFHDSAALGWGVGPDGTLQHAGSDGFWWAQVMVNPWGLVFAGAQNAATPAAISVMAQAQDAAARSWE